MEEDEIWNKLINLGKSTINPEWICEVYSLNLSQDLRYNLAERLGLLGNISWQYISKLIKLHGNKEELIMAAGLSHHKDAKRFLLNLLQDENQLELYLIDSISCWGATLTNNFIKKILKHPSQEIRLSGLDLVEFKLHKLSDEKLLDLLEIILDDFREEIIIKAIKILQRRSSELICIRISKLVTHSSDLIAKKALIALGCIGTKSSRKQLRLLSQSLPKGIRREFAINQLSLQEKYD